MEKMKKICIF